MIPIFNYSALKKKSVQSVAPIKPPSIGRRRATMKKKITRPAVPVHPNDHEHENENDHEHENGHVHEDYENREACEHEEEIIPNPNASVNSK